MNREVIVSDVNVTFSRYLLGQGHALVKEHFPDLNLRSRSWWVYCVGRDHWEFHGPDEFYWHGSATNAYEARYKGWMSWLERKGVDLTATPADEV
jgi:hypothetical protein